ncbi:MAG: chromate transporter family protein [Gammaproteobacteria bacterium]|nr:chromate transporter family protein [Gammaproteobacteria bacterium]
MPISDDLIEASAPADALVQPTVGLLPLLVTFVRLGTMTFGGSVQSWVHREVVERLGWIDNKAFLSGLTVAQVLPGANPVNLALYVGLRLRGAAGAAVAVFGMIVPAFCVTLCLGYLYRSYGHLAAVHFVLVGLAAAGVGATLTMAIKVARRLPRDLMTALIATAVFVVVGLLRWPMVPVVLVAVPLSIAMAFVQEKRNASYDG